MNLIKDFITGLRWWYSGRDSACQCRRHGLGSLIWEYSTCCRQLKSMRHNYWGHSLKPSNHNYWAPVLQLLKPECPTVCAPEEEKPLQWEACALQQRTVPLTTTRESLHIERKTQHNRKLQTILKVKIKESQDQQFGNWGSEESSYLNTKMYPTDKFQALELDLQPKCQFSHRKSQIKLATYHSTYFQNWVSKPCPGLLKWPGQLKILIPCEALYYFSVLSF